MKGTLLISILTTRSNFIEDVELPAEDHPETDTSQWWIGPEMSFTIKTYALNGDLRIWSVGTVDDMIAKAEAVNEKHYGDITGRNVRIDFENSTNEDELRQKFEEAGLTPTIAGEAGSFIFWRPNGGEYSTKGEPEEV